MICPICNNINFSSNNVICHGLNPNRLCYNCYKIIYEQGQFSLTIKFSKGELMFLINWYREFTQICLDNKNRQVELQNVCESCETLKLQLALVNKEKQELLAKLLAKPEIEAPKLSDSEIKPIQMNKHIPWKVRQQMLETEDREKAKLLNQQKTNEITVEDLEKELISAETRREGMHVQEKR